MSRNQAFGKDLGLAKSINTPATVKQITEPTFCPTYLSNHIDAPELVNK
jgi:hypothetical protein